MNWKPRKNSKSGVLEAITAQRKFRIFRTSRAWPHLTGGVIISGSEYDKSLDLPKPIYRLISMSPVWDSRRGAYRYARPEPLGDFETASEAQEAAESWQKAMGRTS